MKSGSLIEFVSNLTKLPGYTSAMGIEVLRVEPGFVELAVPRRREALQFAGTFHGGVIAGLAEHAAGAVVSIALPEGRIAVSIDLNVSFLAPGSGDRLIARARPTRIGGSISVAQIEIFSDANGEETLCAIANITLRNIDQPETG